MTDTLLALVAFADRGGRRAAGRPQLARQARHARRLPVDRVHRPLGLADEPDRVFASTCRGW